MSLEGADKTELFFSLLAGVYGAAKMNSQWPTDFDVEARNALWGDQISSLPLSALRMAIDNATKQQEMGEKEFMWPNIGLILSGCKRYGTAAHKPYLPSPPKQLPTLEKVEQNISSLRNLMKGAK